MATGTAVDVVMPQMGVSVSEGTITKWLKQVGEEVQADEPLLEISTDKVDTEVPSPGTGLVSEILVQEGETVEVGTLLARIGGDGGAAAPPREEPPEPATQEAADEAMASASEGARPRRSKSRPRHRARPPSRRGTGRRSCRRSWRGSPPSTASTRRRCRAPGPAAG
jgi:2-oxoglutarate dehydrogenase E2 component (dihydrolipoamide succinyltransferase)